MEKPLPVVLVVLIVGVTGVYGGYRGGHEAGMRQAQAGLALPSVVGVGKVYRICGNPEPVWAKVNGVLVNQLFNYLTIQPVYLASGQISR